MTKIEVGANTGTDTQNLAADGSLVYAFEPTRELLPGLWSRFQSNPNVHIIPMAIDIECGFAEFKIAGHHDWGCSSLYDFSGDWQREDFYVTNTYQVPKITLLDFCNLYGVGEIDYLWVDAQGNDFRCLQSLGSKIKDVKQGKCEVSLEKRLYAGVDNHVDTVVPWLESQGFKVTVVPDTTNAEADIHFAQ